MAAPQVSAMNRQPHPEFIVAHDPLLFSEEGMRSAPTSLGGFRARIALAGWLKLLYAPVRRYDLPTDPDNATWLQCVNPLLRTRLSINGAPPTSSRRLKPRATDERLASARLRPHRCRIHFHFGSDADPRNLCSSWEFYTRDLRSLGEARRSSVARGLSRREEPGMRIAHLVPQLSTASRPGEGRAPR